MKNLRRFKLKEVYHLLEMQMFYLGAACTALTILCAILASINAGYISYTVGGYIFGILIIPFGILGFVYSQKKSKAAAREKSWTDDYRNEAAVRFQFFSNGEDQGWFFAILRFQKIVGQPALPYDSIGITARDSELYFSPGLHRAEIETNEFENIIVDIGISDNQIGERLWMQINLTKKHQA